MKNLILMSIMFLALIPLGNAKQTFYNSLDKEAVEDGGGTVHGGSFEPGVLEQGFLRGNLGRAQKTAIAPSFRVGKLGI